MSVTSEYKNKVKRRVDYRKLTKDVLISNYIKAEDYFVELEDKIKDLTAKHSAEMKGLRESYQAGADEVEEEYNQSHSYQYVRQILQQLATSEVDRDYYQKELERLQQNGYEDLTKEITLLKNKIVRMA